MPVQPDSRLAPNFRPRARRALALAILAAAALPMGTRPSEGQATQPAAVAVPAGPVELATPPARPQQERNPGGLMDRAAESTAQVYVDDSFASVDKLRTAIRYSNQGQSQLAINEYQNIINNYGQKLVYLNDNSYVSITDFVREKLLQLPAVKSGMYDQLFGGEAQKAVDAAVAGRDAATLIRVCDRYFPSAAAFAGLQQAAEWYFERGEFAPASRTWQTLLSHPLVATSKRGPDLLFRAALAESLARNTAAAKGLRDRLEKEFPGATGTVFGQEVKLLAKLDELAAAPSWDVSGVDLAREDWPAFGGGPARSKLLAVNAAIGARLWSAPINTAPETPAGPEAINRNRQIAIDRARGGEAEGPALSSFSALAGGTLFVHTGERLLALSANAGASLWSYPPQQPAARTVNPEAMVNRYANTGRPAAHDAPAVFGDSVFAVMPTSSNSEGSSAGWANPRIAYSMGVPVSRVVSVSREDGTERWSTSANEVKLEVDAPAAVPGEGQAAVPQPRIARVNTRGAFSFVGSPLVTRQGVFVMARRVTDASFAQQYLVRLDRETGEVTWSCYLCSTSSGSMYGNPYFSLGSIPVPTLVDDVLYISTGQGADCAVDANIGRILWLRVVDAGTATRTPGEFYTSNVVSVPAWRFNPPVITGNSMIVADSSALRVYDRWNGKILNSFKTGGALPPRIDVLSGPVDSQLVITGGNRTVMLPLAELEKKNGDLKPAWQIDVPTEVGKPQGRPFLTTSAYYIPFERKLVQVNLKSGTREAWDWPNTEKDTPGKPGNLLVTAEQVVVVNDAEVAGYSKWETALENRLARIAQSPNEPKVYLDLAEISFRTNHHDRAQENMKKSVDLANAAGNAGAGGGQKAAAEILTRLYRTNLGLAEQLLGKNEAELRDRARFYYEQCKSAAREPEQQAEWRLRLAELALKQKRPEEAATLYNEVLTDPALRTANYRESEVLASAGATAEQRMRKIITDTNTAAAGSGAELYRRFEDQATALLEKARTGRDLPALHQVMEGYPNAKASVVAATELASAYTQKQDWQNARKVLWWLVPRTQGGTDKEAHKRALGDLVRVSMGLKKYASAAAWAARGSAQFKDAPLTTSTGETTTFASLRKQVADAAASAGGAGAGGVLAQIEGRLPKWHGNPIEPPLMDTAPLDDSNVLEGKLLAPVESSLAFRKPNLLFLQKDSTLRVYDTAKGANAFNPVTLPKRDNCVLLGVAGKTAILLSADTAIGVDLESQRVWTQNIRAATTLFGSNPVPPEQHMQVIGGGQVQINGRVFIPGPDGVVIDAEGHPVPRNILQGGGDAELQRRGAFLTLQNPRFSTARLLNNTLLIVSGNHLTAINVETGQPAWRERGDRPVILPSGRPVAIVGNEDILAVQIDAADNSSSTFLTIDADTGQIRKILKLKDERATWRALGDDGSLFVVTDTSVAAYDLVGGSAGGGGSGGGGGGGGGGETLTPLWRRNDIQSRFASATALTLDGLVLVDNTLNVWCLSPSSGEMRWSSAPRLPLGASLGTIATLRSVVDGENVIFQASQSSAAFRSMPTGDDQRAWEARYATDTPMLQSIQLTDPFVVELAMGSLNNNQNAVRVIFRDRKGGKLTLSQEIAAASPGAAAAARSSPDRPGPSLKAWQVLDNGIALQVGDETHFWRNKAVKEGGEEKSPTP